MKKTICWLNDKIVVWLGLLEQMHQFEHLINIKSIEMVNGILYIPFIVHRFTRYENTTERGSEKFDKQVEWCDKCEQMWIFKSPLWYSSGSRQHQQRQQQQYNQSIFGRNRFGLKMFEDVPHRCIDWFETRKIFLMKWSKKEIHRFFLKLYPPCSSLSPFHFLSVVSWCAAVRVCLAYLGFVENTNTKLYLCC